MTLIERSLSGSARMKEWMMITITGRQALGPLLACALLWGPAGSFAHGLTNEELGRLVKAVDKHGSRTRLPQDVASILQLKPAQLAPDIKEAAWLDEQGTRHGFAPLNDGSGFFMFSSGKSAGQTVYFVDPDLHLIHAARTLLKGAPMLALPNAEAQRELDEEFRRWSKVLSPEGPSAPKPLSLKGTPLEPEPYPFKQPANPTKP
jgi:hypothetical protein